MYLIIGGSGFLGSYLIRSLLEETEETLIATYCSYKPSVNNKIYYHERIEWIEFSLLEENTWCYLKDKVQDKKLIVFFLAAMHSPDRIEKDVDKAHHINVLALDNFIRYFKKNIYDLYYASSIVVYGEGENLKEDAPFNPSNAYGHSKIESEKIILSYKYNVLRYGLLIGPSLLIHKETFFDKIIFHLKNKIKMNFFSDQYVSMIDFAQAAQYSARLSCVLKPGGASIINICGDKAYSKWEMAQKIAQAFSFSLESIQGISIKEENNIFSAKRSQYTHMSNEKLKKLLNLTEIDLDFSLPLVQFLDYQYEYIDQRGQLIELINKDWTQVNYVFSKKNTLRGGHYHVHNRELFFVIKGKFELSLSYQNKKEKYLMQDNDFFYINSNVKHSFNFIEDTQLIAFYDRGISLDNGEKDIMQ